MKVILSIIASVGLLFFVSSCSKAPVGATGPAGATGAAGAGASFYVFYDSIAPTLTPSTGWNGTDSIAGINPDYFDHKFTLSYLSITAGQQPPLVKVYYTTVSGTSYQELPQTNVFQNPDKLDFSFTNGSVSITYLNNALNQPPYTLYIKIVVIPIP